MIELSWNFKEIDDTVKHNIESYLVILNFMSWMMNTIKNEEDLQGINFNGILTLLDTNYKFVTLLMCDHENQKKLLNILQQPPEEYKEKYVACVLSEEPQPVQEKTEDDETDDDDNISVEVEET